MAKAKYVYPCGKRRYRDRQAAKEALKRLRWAHLEGHTECRAYKCDDCSGFHLTKQPTFEGSRA